MKIGIDAMGGDHAPQAVLDGAIAALDRIEGQIVLYGDATQLEKALISYNYPTERLSIVHCRDVIAVSEEPVKAIKTKKQSSMVLAFEDLRNQTLDAFVSAGSTGALLAGGALKVGRIKGIKRPALTIPYPTSRGIAVLSDAGANTNCDANNLLQFALMASQYAEKVVGIAQPRIGLVNVGTEANKGSQLYKDSYHLLTSALNERFIGNVEARDIPSGVADVMICDGFTGNVVLKLSEGVASAYGDAIKTAIMETIWSKLAGRILKKGLTAFKKSMDYTEYGGAPLLGLKHPVIKAHGSSNKKAFMNALIYAEKYAQSDIISRISDELQAED